MGQHHPSAEETVWQGHPSHVVAFWTYVFCALLFWLVIPIFIALWKWLEVRSTRYELTTQRILSTTGIFSKHTDSIELYRVKDFCVREPFWYRLFGVGNVHLDTSDRSSPVFEFRAIREPRALADAIRHQVEHLRSVKGVREMDMDVENREGGLHAN